MEECKFHGIMSKTVLSVICVNNVRYNFQGNTGFPWIDAVMRQLRTEGWIPHMARQAVGCFLTRGCLWINWEEGFKVRNTQMDILQ